MQRRSFLIQASSVMAGLCAGSAIVQPTAAAEGQPLSTPNSSKPPLKKRAILIGIAQNAEAGVMAELSNDLLLQKQLLQLRYGFSEPEIVQLTADEVTLAQVTTAIEYHLGGADVGIFHFSGLLSDASELRLRDGVISLATLAEQLKSSKVQHLTTVLDLKANTAIPIEVLSKFPGLLVQPLANPQTSLTQAWTQALWNSEKITVNLSTNSSVPWRLTGDRKNESAYFITALQPLGAGAVQQSKSNQTLNNQTLVWLGGLSPNALALIGPGSILQVQHDRRLELLQVTERQGRSATATASGSVAMGDPVLESIRRIPRKLGLTLMLGDTLSKIETVDAISAFSEVKSIDILKPAKTILSQNADYIFTQLQPVSNADGNGFHHYGLMSNNTHDLIEGTWGESNKTVKAAVRRLLPKLRSLQARKRLLMTLHNNATSVPTLAVKAKLNRVNEKNNSPEPIQNLPNTTKVQPGDRLRYEIQNLGRSEIYWLLWQWDNTLTGTIVLPPTDSSLGIISSGANQPVMSGIARPDWTAQAVGKIESFLVCSSTPFTTTYSQLISGKDDDRFVHTVTDPLAIMDALFTDLQGAIEPINETYALDLAKFVTLPFHYEVVAS